MFPKTFPLAPYFLIPYHSALVEAKGIFLCWGSAACSKNIGQGPIKWLLLGKQKKKKKKGFGKKDEIRLSCKDGIIMEDEEKGMKFIYRRRINGKKFEPFLDLCVSSLRRGHANLLCIVPILSDVSEETTTNVRFPFI